MTYARMLVTLICFGAFAGLAQDCAHTPCPVAGQPCPGPATCATACLHGQNLGCDWATPTPMGATCAQVCANAAQTVPWNVAKLTAATTCTP